MSIARLIIVNERILQLIRQRHLARTARHVVSLALLSPLHLVLFPLSGAVQVRHLLSLPSWVALFISALWVAGCGESELAQRLRQSRQDIRGQLDSGHPLFRWQATTIHARLEGATLGSLASPELCAAGLDARPDSNTVLLVHWVERYPTPDGVRLTAADSSTGFDLMIDAGNHEENRKDAKVGVVFTGAFPVSDYPDVRQLESMSEVSVALVKDGAVVSNWIRLTHLANIYSDLSTDK